MTTITLPTDAEARERLAAPGLREYIAKAVAAHNDRDVEENWTLHYLTAAAIQAIEGDESRTFVNEDCWNSDGSDRGVFVWRESDGLGVQFGYDGVVAYIASAH